jgi:spore maturation protein CgeB
MSQTDVLVTSTFADRLNTNSSIREYLFRAFASVLGDRHVACCPLELATRQIKQLGPKLVVAVGSLASDTSNLRQLRRSADATSSVLAYWLHDDPYEFDYAFKAELTADIIFSSDAWSASHYRHENIHHLPLAGSPEAFHRPVLSVRTREIGLFFCGAAYPNRIDLLRKADDMLSRFSVAILGSGWPAEIRCAQNRRLTASQMADYAQRSRLTLNVGRELSIANRRYALPSSTPGPRTFDIALSGSAQIYFVSSLEISDYFEPGTEIILMDGLRDLEHALERAYDEPDAIEQIAARAQARAIKDHTYEDRARKIISACATTGLLSIGDQEL